MTASDGLSGQIINQGGRTMTTANNPKNQQNYTAPGSSQIRALTIRTLTNAAQESAELANAAPDGQEKAYYRGREQVLKFSLSLVGH